VLEGIAKNTRRALMLCTLALPLAAASGCKKGSGSSLPEGMPEGTPVTLTEKERDPAAVASMKGWMGWHLKGLKLKAEGQFQEAVFCFRQAILAYPAQMPADIEADPRRAALHSGVPTDTYLQLAVTFLELREKKWALHFLDAFDAAQAGGGLTAQLREKATALP
jgi:hypothetical protein